MICFSSSVYHRCFFINLYVSYPLCTVFYLTQWDSPTGGIAAALIFFSLNLNPHQGRTLKQHLNEFDFLGLFLIVSGVVLLLVGFNQSETSCEKLKSEDCVHLYLTVTVTSSRVFGIHHCTPSSWMCGSFCWSSERGIHQTFTHYPSTSLQGEFYDTGCRLFSWWLLDPNHCHYIDHKFPSRTCFFHGRILSSSLFSSSWSLRNWIWCGVSLYLWCRSG